MLPLVAWEIGMLRLARAARTAPMLMPPSDALPATGTAAAGTVTAGAGATAAAVEAVSAGSAGCELAVLCLWLKEALMRAANEGFFCRVPGLPALPSTEARPESAAAGATPVGVVAALLAKEGLAVEACLAAASSL